MFMILRDMKMTLLGKLEIRKKFRELINLGLKDIYRLKNKTKQEYTFWDYFAGSWQKKLWNED